MVPARSGSGSPPRGVFNRFASLHNRTDLALCLLLSAATLAVFVQIRFHPFLSYDDPLYVTGNSAVQGGLTRDGLLWAFTTTHTGNYHPLTWLSHMLDSQMFGLDPGSHHLMSVALHIASAVLLYMFLKRATSARYRSAFVAAMFALHPLHVESVAWAAERKDVLSALFWMTTLTIYGAYVRRPGLMSYASVLVVFTLGLLSKSMLVSLPFVLLLLDVWPLARTRIWRAGSWARLLAEKAPLFALAGVFSVVTVMAQKGNAATASLQTLPLDARIGNALVAVVAYIAKALVPAGLAIFYPHHGGPPAAYAAAAGLLIVVVTSAVIRSVRHRPYLAVGWLWYLGTLVPVIGLVQVGSQAMADRYTYVPLVGFFIALSWGGSELASRYRWSRKALAPASVVIVLACSALTWRQLQFWRGSIPLFGHALSCTRGNYVAHTLLGNALGAEGRLDEALAQYSEAVNIKPDYDLAQYSIGMVLLKKDRGEESIPHFVQALRLNPGNAEAHASLGFALYEKGRVDEAIDHYRQALTMKPDDTFALQNLAWIRATSADARYRDASEAVRLAERACTLTRNSVPRALSTLAAALAESGRFREAVATIQRTIDLARSPDQAQQAQALGFYEDQLRLHTAGRPLRISTQAAR